MEFLKLSGLIIGSQDLVFRLDRRLKHNTRGPLQVIEFKPFQKNLRICVVFTIRHYINRTTDIRNKEDQMLISFKPPYQKVCSSTISHSVRELLSLAGIDSNVFTTHSVRGAVASQLDRLNVPVKSIMAKASWRTESTFRHFYNKPLMDPDPTNTLLNLYRNTRGFGVVDN